VGRVLTTEPRPALANFYFGGFGNNYVDAGNEKRYREWYAFPGVNINGVGGRNFLKSMIELNLPPVRFAHIGTPGFHATWMRPALFATALVTDVDAASARRLLVNAGAQLDFRLSLLSSGSVAASRSNRGTHPGAS
jgi:hypothetical protein